MKYQQVFEQFQLWRQRCRHDSRRDAGATFLGRATWLAFGRVGFALFAIFVLAVSASAQEQSFQMDPAQTSVKFTLGDVLHTVHGTFKLKQGTLQLQPAGKMAGEIVAIRKFIFVPTATRATLQTMEKFP